MAKNEFNIKSFLSKMQDLTSTNGSAKSKSGYQNLLQALILDVSIMIGLVFAFRNSIFMYTKIIFHIYLCIILNLYFWWIKVVP